MKIKLTNRRNNNTEIFNNLSIEDISTFIDKEFGWEQENELGFVFLYKTLGELSLYKTLGELSFQNNEVIKYIIERLNYKVSQVKEPNEKDRYNIYLLRLLNNIDDIVSGHYLREDKDYLKVEEESKKVLFQGRSNLNYTIDLRCFLNQLDIDLVLE